MSDDDVRDNDGDIVVHTTRTTIVQLLDVISAAVESVAGEPQQWKADARAGLWIREEIAPLVERLGQLVTASGKCTCLPARRTLGEGGESIERPAKIDERCKQHGTLPWAARLPAQCPICTEGEELASLASDIDDSYPNAETLFVERWCRVDHHEDVYEEPWNEMQHVESHDSKILRQTILPALRDACHIKVQEPAYLELHAAYVAKREQEEVERAAREAERTAAP